MFLNKLAVRNFLGIYDAALEFGRFTILYGANGAGKTSLADAIFHLSTGEKTRGVGTFGELIRRGAKSAFIDGELASGSGLTREVTNSGRELYIDGVLTKEKDAALALREVLPASLPAFRSALRSGAILDLKPAELQQLLVELTGASVDQEAVAKVLGESTVAAMARLKLPIPSSLGQLDTTAERAAKDRPAAKTKKSAAENDLGHVPPVARDVAEEAARPDVTTTGQEKKLATLRAQRDTALRSQAGADGAREERRADAAARLREAEGIAARALPPAVAAPSRTKLDDAQRAVVRAQEHLAAIDRDVIALQRTTAGSMPVAPTLAEAQQAVEDAQKALAVAEAKRVALVKDGKALGEQVARLRSGGAEACPHCTQAIPAAVVDALEARMQTLRGQHADAVSLEEDATETCAQLRQQLVAASQRDAHEKAVARLAELQASRPAAVAAFDAAVASEKALRAEHDAIAQQAATYAAAKQAHDSAVAEAERLRQEIARIDAPSPVATVSLADLDAAIARATTVRDAIPALEKKARFEKWIAEADVEIEDRNAVEKACKSAKAELLARAVGPFVDAANTALATMAPGYTVEVVAADGLSIVARHHGLTLPIEMLSDGFKTRVLYALQLATVRLAKVPLLILDRSELVDDEGRGAIAELASQCADEGIQVLLLSCKAAPAEVEEGFTAYVVSEGRVSRVPTRTAQAA